MISHHGRGKIRYSSINLLRRSTNYYILLSFIISNKLKRGTCHSISNIASNPSSSSPITYYYTCRHTFEEKLIEELNLPESKSKVINNKRLWGLNRNNVVNSSSKRNFLLKKASTPCPGLVKAEYEDLVSTSSSLTPDPIYALQVLPNSVSVKGNTIRELSANIISSQGLDNIEHSSIAQELLKAPKGSLTVHALVPDMLKGNPKPKMIRRVNSISNDVISTLQKAYPCSRKKSDNNGMEWILQLLLISSDEIIVSLSPIHYATSSSIFSSQMTWPCSSMTCGLANVEDELFFKRLDDGENNKKLDSVKTPSSAYRKLLEAISCVGCMPNPNVDSSSFAVDLGASPGGWVSMLYKLGYNVIAVDRSKLDPTLMKQKDSIIFQTGDAFSYNPSDKKIILMVSDIISYPNKIIELLETWCNHKWADYLIVTMKFKDNNDLSSSSSNWDYICNAIQVVEDNGYVCRVKHFFNNKNEVMFMIAKNDNEDNYDERLLSMSNEYLKFSPQSMFPILLPKAK